MTNTTRARARHSQVLLTLRPLHQLRALLDVRSSLPLSWTAGGRAGSRVGLFGPGDRCRCWWAQRQTKHLGCPISPTACNGAGARTNSRPDLGRVQICESGVLLHLLEGFLGRATPCRARRERWCMWIATKGASWRPRCQWSARRAAINAVQNNRAPARCFLPPRCILRVATVSKTGADGQSVQVSRPFASLRASSAGMSASTGGGHDRSEAAYRSVGPHPPAVCLGGCF